MERILVLLLLYLTVLLLLPACNGNGENKTVHNDSKMNSLQQSDILLITKLGSDTKLYRENDFAAYGAMQTLDRLGLFYDIVYPDKINEDMLNYYQAVIYPYTELSPDLTKKMVTYAEGGGSVILGGLNRSDSDIGIASTEPVKIKVPEVSAIFRTGRNHSITKGIASTGLPVLSTGNFYLLKGDKCTAELGTVTVENEKSGSGVIIKSLENGCFIIFGNNLFETIGYGMGMATAEGEEHYKFETKPQENNKVFNWQTNKSIKELHLELDTIWGDEYSNLLLNSIMWASEQTGSIVLQKWFWPDNKDFAASIQHDWDSGRGDSARGYRELEAECGVKSALYVLVSADFSTQELKAFRDGGWEIGLHADKINNSSRMSERMETDLEKTAKAAEINISDIKGVVHHYVRFFKDTPLKWQGLGFVYDATFYDMDWKDKFFTGTSMPFYLKYGNQILKVVELPSRCSDGMFMTNNGVYYLGEKKLPKALERIRHYIDAVEETHGHASINTHPVNYNRYKSLEREFISYIKGLNGYDEKNAWFARPVDIARWYIDRMNVKTDGKKISENSKELIYEYELKGDVEALSIVIPGVLKGMKPVEIKIDGKPVKFSNMDRYKTNCISAVVNINGQSTLTVKYR